MAGQQGKQGNAPAANPLLYPNQQLAGPALQSAAQALTNAQTQGPLTELARQLALSNRQGAGAQRRTAGYFRQLGKFSRGAVGEEKGIAGQLNSQLQNIAGQTQGQLSQFGQQARSQPGLQGLARTGLDGGAMANLSAELARQKGIEAQNAGTFRSSGAVQGANYRGLSAENQGAYAIGGQQRLGEIAQATRLANEPILAKIANLRATEGSLLAANEGKLRQQEIANRFTSKGLGLKQKALNITSQNNVANQSLRQQQIANGLSYQQAQIKIAGINAQLRSQGLSETHRHNLVQERQALMKIKKGTPGPLTTPTGTRALTTNEQNRIFGQIGSVQQLIRDAKKRGLAPADIRAMLLNGQNPAKTRYPSAVIDSAWALDGWGYLTPTQIRELNNMGVIVGGRYRRGQVPPPGNGNMFSPGGATGPAQ